MRALRRYFAPLSLVEAADRLVQGDLPPRAVAVTFDDGYADNASCALPILNKYHIPATVFVSTGFLNGGRMWNDSVIEAIRQYDRETLDLRHFNLGTYATGDMRDKIQAIDSILRAIKHLDPKVRLEIVRDIEKCGGDLPQDLMMDDGQVRSLADGGVSVGAHTVNHPILASIPFELAQQEISESRATLESLVQREVVEFAYPNGRPGEDYHQEHRDLVASMGFRAAASTHWGVAAASSDRFQLPRFTPWDRTEARFVVRLLLHYRNEDPLQRGAA